MLSVGAPEIQELNTKKMDIGKGYLILRPALGVERVIRLLTAKII
jgi:hypothetical protein